MAGFLLKTKIDTSLENVFRDLHIHPTIGEVFSNGTKLISSVTDVMVIKVLEKVLDVRTCIHYWNTFS
jgi:hypothetical protein